MTDSETNILVTLSDETVSGLESRIQDTDFESVESYLIFLIEEIEYRLRVETDGDDDTTGTIGESEVKDRLESLGYLNS